MSTKRHRTTEPSLGTTSSSSSSLLSLPSLPSTLRSTSMLLRFPIVVVSMVLSWLELNDTSEMLYTSVEHRQMIHDYLHRCTEIFITNKFSVAEKLQSRTGSFNHRLVSMMSLTRNLQSIHILIISNYFKLSSLMKALVLLMRQNCNTLRTLDLPFLSECGNSMSRFNKNYLQIVQEATKCARLESLDVGHLMSSRLHIEDAITMISHCKHLKRLDVQFSSIYSEHSEAQKELTLDQINRLFDLDSSGKQYHHHCIIMFTI
jgi:hypothetical protein